MLSLPAGVSKVFPLGARSDNLKRPRGLFLNSKFLELEDKAKHEKTCLFNCHTSRLIFSLLSPTAAVKNQVTGLFILNAKSEDAEPKKLIENGLEWDYSMDGEKETLKTSGPLHEGIVVMVSEEGA